MSKTERLTHTFFYSLAPEKVQHNSWSGGHSGWVMSRPNTIRRVRNLIANRITEDGWTLVSIDTVITGHYYADALTNSHGVGGGSSWGAGRGYGASATDGLLVTVEKRLPAELVGKICEARSRIASALHEIESEPIEYKEQVKMLTTKKAWIFRGVEYADFEAAATARSNAAYQAEEAVSQETGVVAMLATRPNEAEALA